MEPSLPLSLLPLAHLLLTPDRHLAGDRPTNVRYAAQKLTGLIKMGHLPAWLQRHPYLPHREVLLVLMWRSFDWYNQVCYGEQMTPLSTVEAALEGVETAALEGMATEVSKAPTLIARNYQPSSGCRLALFSTLKG